MTEFNPTLKEAKLILGQMALNGSIAFSPSAVEPYCEGGGGTLSLRVGTKDGSEYAVLFPRSSHSLKSKSDEKKMLDFINSYNVGVKSEIEIPTLTYAYHARMPFFYMKGFKGDVLHPRDYDNLSDEQKHGLAVDLARFLCAIHSIPVSEAAGIIPAIELNAKNDLLRRIGLKDIESLAGILDKIIPSDALQKLDESVKDFNYDKVVSHGDLHGRNIAVDKSKQKILNGVFDFGNAAISNRAVDFYKLSVIHRNLMRRVVKEYNAASPEQIKIADADFIYLALFGGRIKESPNDGIIRQSLQNFSEDWRDNEKDKFPGRQKMQPKAVIQKYLKNKFQND